MSSTIRSPLAMAAEHPFFTFISAPPRNMPVGLVPWLFRSGPPSGAPVGCTSVWRREMETSSFATAKKEAQVVSRVPRPVDQEAPFGSGMGMDGRAQSWTMMPSLRKSWVAAAAESSGEWEDPGAEPSTRRWSMPPPTSACERSLVKVPVGGLPSRQELYMVVARNHLFPTRNKRKGEDFL